MGVPGLFLGVFLRKKKNKSGSVSVQIISKSRGRYRVIQTIGCGKTDQEIERLWLLGKQEMGRISGQSGLFVSQIDTVIESIINQLDNASIKTVGPELIFGSIYDSIGYHQVDQELFRHLVICRLVFPLSKLKTVDYLYRYQGIQVNVNSVYRFLDKLHGQLKDQVEQIAYQHTKKTLNNNLSVVFYDMTTIYFEASDEDDLRRTGFSKEGKHQNPQIYLGLLVGLEGYAIGYDIFEGNIYEGHTLIPFIKKMAEKFDLGKPIIVADAGLLSNDNINALQDKEYEYILGARIKNETEHIINQITSKKWTDKQVRQFSKSKQRLVVSYSDKRAAKDKYNRKRGLSRLEKRLKSGKLTKSNINNKGYNKYLKLHGKIKIEIDYDKFENDSVWDGLKGYVTNSGLSKKQVIANYNNLWHIERAFRMSKTDLKIRPIYHRLRHRIEAHICISFTAYCIYKELQRVLKKEKSKISVQRAAQLTHNMYQITYQLPESKQIKSRLLQMDDQQAELYRIIQKNYSVSQR